MLELLEANPHIIMDEHYEGNDEMTEEPEAGVDVRMWGNMVAFLERLDDEHFKSLQVGRMCFVMTCEILPSQLCGKLLQSKASRRSACLLHVHDDGDDGHWLTGTAC